MNAAVSGVQTHEASKHEALKRAFELELRVSSALAALLTALRASSDLEQLLPRALAVFVDVTQSSAGVLWLREADTLRARTGHGLADGWQPGGSVPLSASPEEPTSVEALARAGELPSEHPLAAALVADGAVVLCLPLSTGDALSGVVCLRLPAAAAQDERPRLSLLAEHAATAIAARVEHDGLARSLRARDEVLGIVAHDLRNPLNVIAAAASSLHQRLPDLLSRRPVERIMRAAQRAEHLIRDLLDISAIESGQFSIEKRQLDTANIILAAIDSQQGLAASSSVILASDLSPGLPAIDADEERLLEVLENLVGNAIKFTMAGGTTTVGASAKSTELLVWVKDNGPGIPSSQLPHLFDRFWQGARGDRRGAGLGLTICRAIVEAHGGRIWAESQLGEGTTVYFTLPKRELTPKASAAQVVSLLLVDDRPENLLALKAILDRPDYRLVTATTGEEELGLALRETFAVALIDIAMPGMDGLEVAVHLKELERSRDIPIIFITAFGDDPEEIHRAYSAGGADYLVKPLDTEIVRKKVAVFVDLSKRRGETNPRSQAATEE
ncbi:MAG TPA: hybrid sensor histidine kinase/response regulator [Polyangiaceae bacterium]|nr:hybrid sensor histidine kinase/response regulator [Polyangiaceae bacterium]